MKYDRSVKMYDEGYTPLQLEELTKSNTLGKGSFIDPFFSSSYMTQMREIYKLNPARALEIGPGEGFVNNYLSYLGIEYNTLDIKGDPTYKSTLEEFDPIKLELGGSYDLVCCFQMLEHSPYQEFKNNLKKFYFLSNKYVFISLPYDCVGFRINFNWHQGQRKDYKFKFQAHFSKFNKNRKYRDEYIKEFPWAVHYWEIGRSGYPVKRIKNDILDCGFKIKKIFFQIIRFIITFFWKKGELHSP